MSETKKGVIALVLCYTIWGLSTIFYRALSDVPSIEVLAHRTFWSCIIFSGYIIANGRLNDLLALLAPRSGWGGLYKVGLAALFVSTNWFLFIDTIATGRALEAALGYYILPLVSIVLGFFWFGERLRGLQYLSIAMVALAVTVLAVGLGTPPWRGVSLALLFAIYGAIKKGFDAGPILSVTAEVVLLVPFALIWILGAEFADWGSDATHTAGMLSRSWQTAVMAVGAGLLTGIPLILFAYATRRVTLISVGLGQYYQSTIQLLIAVFLFGEVFTSWHMIAMPIIWVALAIYLFHAWRTERQARRARKASTSLSALANVSK